MPAAHVRVRSGDAPHLSPPPRWGEDVRIESTPPLAVARLPYRPHTRQHAFHLSGARYRGLISGIRGGKTLAGCIESLRLATKPGTYPGLGWIVAPDYPMLQDSTMREFFRWCPRQVIAGWHKTDRLLTLVDGNEIQFKSANEPDSLRGATLKWFWVDEGALCQRAVWNILLGRVASTRGRGILTTTPKGFNWVYDLVVSGDPDYEFVIFKSSDNPYLPRDEIERLYRQYSPAFARQELEASFEHFVGKVYQDFRADVHAAELTYRPEWPLYRALDWGFNNPTVCLWIQTDPSDRVYIISEYYEVLKTHQENALAIVEAEKLAGYEPAAASYCDPADAAARAEFVRHGISTLARRTDLQVGLELVRRALKERADGKPGQGKPGLLVDRRCVNTIREFNSYRYPDAPAETLAAQSEVSAGMRRHFASARREEPVPADNHAMDALRYFFVNWQTSRIEAEPFEVR